MRRVVILRDQGWSWEGIAAKVVNRRGQRPSWGTCRNVYKEFQRQGNRRPYRYDRCGRTPWKVTPAVRAFLLQQLRALRRRNAVTASTLQASLAAEHGVALALRRSQEVLQHSGYQWLPRAQKPKLSRDRMLQRLAFARRLLGLSDEDWRREFLYSMDGVVIPAPPTDATARANHCVHGYTHMWRKASERAHPELAGGDPYPQQAPRERLVAFWGGIGRHGFSVVSFHPRRKLHTEEWVATVHAGKLQAALRKASGRQRGPWRILCDNERFLDANDSKQAYTARSISLLHVPPQSPDLNPIEKYWSWLRRVLRRMDLADLHAGRPAATPQLLKSRIHAISRSQKSTVVARNCVQGLRKVCQEVIRKKGARSAG